MPKAKSALSKKLKGYKQPSKREFVWKGPEMDGITQSMLGKFLTCRYRFGLLVKEGLKPVDSFQHRVEYGNMWHILEEAHAEGDRGDKGKQCLSNYCDELRRKYPMQQEEILHWQRVCLVQFPVYADYWSKNQDVVERTPIFQEEVFEVPYILPSGRTVYLRGKFDSVDMIGRGSKAVIFLQENKTKGDIDEAQLQRQLKFDLQTMMYLIALQSYEGLLSTKPVAGVRYNVIRRPLSGGKGTIKQKQNETADEFYKRLQQYILDEPGHYFMRWTVNVTEVDYQRFRHQFFDPCLEELCWWWDLICGNSSDRLPPDCNYRMPYGVYSPLIDGGSSELDEYLDNGSLLGLRRVNNLFSELEEI